MGNADNKDNVPISFDKQRPLDIDYPLQRGKHVVYNIKQVLGKGGYGIVYKAETRIETKNGPASATVNFAIKEFFPREYSRNAQNALEDRSEADFKKNKARFKAEAVKLRKLTQIPNVVNVNECFEQNNTIYYVMEFIEGDGNLQQFLKGNEVSEQDALRIMTPIIVAVDKLHCNKLMHLDIKPTNIMLGEKNSGGENDKKVKIGGGEKVPILIDFGIAESANIMKPQELGYSSKGYSSPEQCNPDGLGYKKRFDPRLDVFALGATLYFLLLGENPISAPKKREEFDGYIAAIDKRLKEKDGIDDSIRTAIVNAMNPYREKRTPTAWQLLRELGVGDDYETELSKRVKVNRLKAVLYLLIAGLVGVAVYYGGYEQQNDVINSRNIQAAIDNNDKVTLTEYASLDSLRAINELVKEYEKDNNILMAWYWAEYVKEHQDSISGDKAVIKALIARSEVLRKNLIENVDTSSVAYKSLSQLLGSNTNE